MNNEHNLFWEMKKKSFKEMGQKAYIVRTQQMLCAGLTSLGVGSVDLEEQDNKTKCRALASQHLSVIQVISIYNL